MEKDYYERYWRKETVDKKGFANLPPELNPDELDKIIKFLKPYVLGHVLDAGCGNGLITNATSKLPNVKEVFGVDISDTGINIAKSRYPHIKFEVSSVINLPFKSGYFDAITAIEIVEHIYDTELMFKEFNRVLKNEGYVIISTTDFNLPKKLIIALFYWEKYFFPTNPHIRFFTKKTLADILSKYGFKTERYKWNDSYFGIMPRGQIMIARKVKDL